LDVGRGSKDNTVKNKLTFRPILTIFDSNKLIEVHTDASVIGIGTVLIEKRRSDAYVAYYSRQTTADQRCYHSYELKTMAIVFALWHFQVYLGLKFKMVTDCNALRVISRSGTYYFWLIDGDSKIIQEYTFDIEYRARSRMSHVDALRNPVPFELEVSHVDVTEGDWILAAQLKDKQILRIWFCYEKPMGETKHYFDEYLVTSCIDNEINVDSIARWTNADLSVIPWWRGASLD